MQAFIIGLIADITEMLLRMLNLNFSLATLSQKSNAHAMLPVHCFVHLKIQTPKLSIDQRKIFFT